MTVEEFIRYLDAHGADLERWPADLRDAARGVAETAAGRAELQAAQALEALLEDSLPAPPELGLKARILGRLPPAAGTVLPDWLTPGRWRPLAATGVAPLALGFVLGFAWPSAEDGVEDAVSALAFSPVFEEELVAEEAARETTPGALGTVGNAVGNAREERDAE